MAIGKAKATGAIVVGSRNILPRGRAGIINKVAIVNGIGVLIEKQPGFGWPGNLRLLQVLAVLLKTPVHSTGGRINACAEAAENGIHREAAVAARKAGGALPGA